MSAVAMANRVGYRGYVTCREFGGLKIPVPIQALMMRDYCVRKKLLYKLHVNENIFPNSYMVLEGLVQNLGGLQGILMTSMFMLPRRPERRAKIYEQIFRQDAGLHFVLEDVVVAGPQDLVAVEEILRIHETLQHCPRSIADAAAMFD